jgi:uncharacterized membrane protein YkvA (DUF1232 family)
MSEEQTNDNSFNKEDFLSALFNPEVPFNYKLFFGLAAFIYTISPIDFIPDLLGPLGFADDVGVLVIAAQAFTHFANKALQKKHDEENQAETIVMDQPDPYNASAQSAASSQPSQPGDKPRLPESHLRRHHGAEDAPYRPVQKPQAQEQPNATDALNDERHEQLIRGKQDRANKTFDELINTQKPESDGWDFSRNDPFAKKRDKNS